MAKPLPSDCQHCAYDRRFPETSAGGWLYFGNNGPYVPCPSCNDDGAFPFDADSIPTQENRSEVF